MAKFRIFLVASPGHLDVELTERSIAEVRFSLESSRYLEGYLHDPDESGVYAPFLIPSCRLQMILEI